MTKHPAAERLIVRLITVLSEEMRMYNELLLVLRKKQSSIIEGTLEGLKETVEQEQSILRKSEAVAATREASLKEVSKALGRDGDIQTLDQLIELVESTYAERLSDIHRSLQRIVQEVILTNEENRYLLDYSIKFVRDAARELIKSSEKFPVYSAEGIGRKEGSGSNLIEGRI
ncbi:MAG: flagellar protein FlgN [Fidelibacterota bacterium]|nr:MAG: flagellar protein FlgN [Candidatus Neomarinimicrobiota bacterium]